MEIGHMSKYSLQGKMLCARWVGCWEENSIQIFLHLRLSEGAQKHPGTNDALAGCTKRRATEPPVTKFNEQVAAKACLKLPCSSKIFEWIDSVQSRVIKCLMACMDSRVFIPAVQHHGPQIGCALINSHFQQMKAAVVGAVRSNHPFHEPHLLSALASALDVCGCVATDATEVPGQCLMFLQFQLQSFQGHTLQMNHI